MLRRSFTAGSLRAFWRYWNAGFNYYLMCYCYRPLRRYLPAGAAFVLTFGFCGLAHDALFLLPVSLVDSRSLPFPFVTCWFLLISLLVLLTERLRLRLERMPAVHRIALHSAFLAGTFACAFALAKVS